MWYKSTITNKIITNISVLDDIYGEDEISRLIINKILIPIQNVDVNDLLKMHSTNIYAVIRYREINKCSLMEAREKVEQLRAEMEDFDERY